MADVIMSDPMLMGPASLSLKRGREVLDQVDEAGMPSGKRTRRVSIAKGPKPPKTPKAPRPQVPIPTQVELVDVRGNPKVLRCIRCKSFVSRHKNHGMMECNQVLANKANPTKRSRRSTKFRMTPKRRDILIDSLKDAAKSKLQEAQVERRFKSLEKWMKKADAKGKLSKNTKKLITGVLKSLDVDYQSYNKKLQALRSRTGL